MLNVFQMLETYNVNCMRLTIIAYSTTIESSRFRNEETYSLWSNGLGLVMTELSFSTNLVRFGTPLRGVHLENLPAWTTTKVFARNLVVRCLITLKFGITDAL